MAKKKNDNEKVVDLLLKFNLVSAGETSDIALKAATSFINLILYESCPILSNRYKALEVLFETAKTDAANFDEFMSKKKVITN